LRQRMARIRVFDPACGSGNFLVIAYKEMRKVEAKINELRGEGNRRSDIPLTNFRGIELRHFSCEIARLALIIAEYQCDVLYRGPKLALAEFLPLKADNWITCGNALRLDWLSLCPPTGTGVRVQREDLDLFSKPLEEAEIEFENEGGETYICGNPPYSGSRKQEEDQKGDLKTLCSNYIKKWKSLDYVAGWMLQARRYINFTKAEVAFVTTSSLCEGLQVSVLWPHLINEDVEIKFAHQPFSWANLAANNAGVTVCIVSLTNKKYPEKKLFLGDEQVWNVEHITPYLIPGKQCFVESAPQSISDLPKMLVGSMPRDGGNLLLSRAESVSLLKAYPAAKHLIRRYLGSEDLIKGLQRNCIWVEETNREYAFSVPELAARFEAVKKMRSQSNLQSTRDFSEFPHRFVYLAGKAEKKIVAVSKVSSERRQYLPVDLLDSNAVASDLLFALYDAPLWNMALIASRLHLVWIATVCGKLKTDFRYSNTLGWNTFPVPTLTDRNKADLTRCAEDILLAREQYFPATIADMYDRDRMDTEFPLVREAHDRNDEALERIYIGRRFKNDTERLEKLFELYTKMTTPQALPKKPVKGKIKSSNT